MSDGYFTARQLPDGTIVVLSGDGLTWDTTEPPTIESAQAHALKLNEWIDRKPVFSRISPFFNPVLPGEPPGPEVLLGSIDRLFAAEERLDVLIHALKGSNNHPQEAPNGTSNK